MSSKSRQMITDLDASDTPKDLETPLGKEANQHRKTFHKKREKTLQTISGNFSRRSKSVECHMGQQIDLTRNDEKQKKIQSAFHEVLQAKERQMEQLLQRLSTLHKYNEQFSEQNDNLKEELKTMDKTILNLQKQVEDCPNCLKLKKQIKTSIDDNKNLNTDIEMMKTLVFRLNVQIENYQDRLRQLGIKGSESPKSQSPKQSKVSKWQGRIYSQTLRPLFEAYDEMINEKQELINQYKKEYEDFSGHFKNILEESNHLHQQLEAIKKEGIAWREEKVRLQAQLNVCRGKAEYHAQKNDLAREKLVEVMQCYEQKNQTLMLELEHLQSAYVRCKSELANMKTLNALPKENITASLKECKNLLKELKEQHTKEKSALEQTIVDLTKKCSDSDSQNDILRREITNLKTNASKESNEVEQLKERITSLQRNNEHCKRSRDRLKARLRIALQWAQKLEQGQENIQSTWEALKRLETIVKHKEAQVRGLHERHLIEIGKMEKKLAQKEETIKTILKAKLAKSTIQT